MKILRLVILLLPFYCSAQTTKCFIQFTDKNNNPFSISNPSAFLSQRALDRRNLKHVPIEENDLPVNPDYIDSVISKGAILFTKSKWFNGITVQADSATRVAIATLPFVQHVRSVNRLQSNIEDEKAIRNKFELPVKIDPNNLFRTQSYSYGQGYDQIHIMNGEYLHDIGFHGENMIIAILDAGFYHANVLRPFDSLYANNQVLGTWDFVANEPSVYEDYDHGMEVLSTIGSNIPGSFVGTAPKASFWLLRTEDVATEHIIEEYNWDAGAEFADSAGADIISTSLGYTYFINPTAGENHTYADMNGHTTPCAISANTAFSKGMLVIASAGNSGSPGDPWHYIGTPADADSALAVGAVDISGNYAPFSSAGPSSDGDVKPNVAAVGEGSTIATTTGGVGGGNGTSFACPILAGSAACLWQAFPTKTNSEIFDAIQRSASQYQTPDSMLGFGIPNFMLADQILQENNVDLPDDYLAEIYPNPFVTNVTLSFYSTSNQDLSVKIFNAIGQNVFGKNFKAEENIYNYFLLPTQDLQKGIYFIEIFSEKNTYINKVVKL